MNMNYNKPPSLSSQSLRSVIAQHTTKKYTKIKEHNFIHKKIFSAQYEPSKEKEHADANGIAARVYKKSNKMPQHKK